MLSGTLNKVCYPIKKLQIDRKDLDLIIQETSTGKITGEGSAAMEKALASIEEVLGIFSWEDRSVRELTMILSEDKATLIVIREIRGRASSEDPVSSERMVYIIESR